MVGSRSSNSKSKLYLAVGGLAALSYFMHWIYTRSEKRTLRHEARNATLLEQMSVRDYVASYLEDPAMKRQFMRQVELVRESWNRLKPNRLELTAHVMYQKLRQEDPSTQEVFDKRLDWSSQERIFTVMIGNLISRLGDPSEEAFLGMLVRLGKRHQALGVKPQQYSSMRRSILASLEELLGHEWNGEYSDAWASVFNFISHVMIKAAQEEGQRIAKGGKEEEAGNVIGRELPGVPGGGGGGGGGGSGCPFAAAARMPVNKVLSGLQLDDALKGNNVETDGHFLHQAVASLEGGGGAAGSSSSGRSS